jgi:hypothetical protein
MSKSGTLAILEGIKRGEKIRSQPFVMSLQELSLSLTLIETKKCPKWVSKEKRSITKSI